VFFDIVADTALIVADTALIVADTALQMLKD
jgi:hypothetical protein